MTGGDAAIGVLALSVGGGGGNAGPASAVATSGVSFDKTLNEVLGKLPIADTLSVSDTVGGSGGVGNRGGTVQVTNEGTVLTGGSNATGIQAQSIGGGGGNGGEVSGAATGRSKSPDSLADPAGPVARAAQWLSSTPRPARSRPRVTAHTGSLPRASAAAAVRGAASRPDGCRARRRRGDLATDQAGDRRRSVSAVGRRQK